MKPVSPIGVVVLGLLLLSGCGTDGVRAPDPDAPSLIADVPSAPPSWFPIGPDISQPSQLADVESGILSLGKQPRWFLGMARTVSSAEYAAYWSRIDPAFPTSRPGDDQRHLPSSLPYPYSVQDVALHDHGVALSFGISTTPDPAVLLLDLNLSSADRPLMREVQSGHTNALPFLFSISIDGKPVTLTTTGGETGGAGLGSEAPYMIPLLSQGSSRRWRIRLDAQSLSALLPDAHAHSVALVAAFSNRQHEVYFGSGEPSLDYLVQPRGAEPDSQILVRSEAVRLQWTGERWTASSSEIGRTALSGG